MAGHLLHGPLFLFWAPRTRDILSKEKLPRNCKKTERSAIRQNILLSYTLCASLLLDAACSASLVSSGTEPSAMQLPGWFPAIVSQPPRLYQATALQQLQTLGHSSNLPYSERVRKNIHPRSCINCHYDRTMYTLKLYSTIQRWHVNLL